jgi:hypothetical protein
VSINRECDSCFWCTVWKDEIDGTFPICTREFMDFKDAMYECKKPLPCKYYTSREEVENDIYQQKTSKGD